MMSTISGSDVQYRGEDVYMRSEQLERERSSMKGVCFASR